MESLKAAEATVGLTPVDFAKPLKPKAKRVASKSTASKPKAKSKAKKPAKPKPAKKAVVKKKTKPKAKAKPAGAIVRSERLDMRLTKAEKTRVVAKAKKLRRTLTSLLIEAIEKIK